MLHEELHTGLFTDYEQQEAQIKLCRGRLFELVFVLGQIGSLVLADWTLQSYPDVPPGLFVVKSAQKFIFPKQEPPVVSQRIVNGFEVGQPTSGLVQRYWRSDYDNRARSAIEILYDDAGHSANLVVATLQGYPEPPPDDASAAIQRAVASLNS